MAKPTESPKLPSLPEPKVVPDQFVARPAPLGWSSNASWTVDIADGPAPAVSPDGTEVAVLTPDEKIAVFDSNGKVLWQDKVPNDAESPVYTTIDSKLVLAVATPDTLYYWAGDGAEATEIELPDSAKVQFFGTSPLVLMGSAGASVVSGGELKTVPNQPRLSTILLAEGDKALMARYQGPLYWSQPGKDLVERGSQATGGGQADRSCRRREPGPRAGAVEDPEVDRTDPGGALDRRRHGRRHLPKTSAGAVDTWDWVPDTAPQGRGLG